MRRSLFFIFFVSTLLVTTSSFGELKFNSDYSLRLRHEFWKNWKDMDNNALDNRNFFRIKASYSGKFDFNKETSLFAKLSDEFRTFPYFAGTSGSYPDKTSSKKGYHFDINEVIFDNLYLDVKKIIDIPLDIRVGRQDFMPSQYGEGFLLADGTPGDGSRTYYFNAVKGSYQLDENNTLDAIYINNPRDEEFLPVINRTMLVKASNPSLDKVPQSLNVTDEEGYVLYLKNKSLKDTYLEGYYIFKRESEEGGVGYQAEKTLLHTLGTYAKYNFSPFTARGQFAYQFGDYGEEERRGFGGYGYLDRTFKDSTWSPVVSLGYIYLSGDNRSTSRNESWDPLFSRYPWISELYILTIAGETGVNSYWTNLQCERATLTVSLTKKTKLFLGYNFLRANAQVAASSIYSGQSKTRGQLIQGKFEYAFNKNISTYFLAEYFLPGKFYTQEDPSVFLRSEVLIKF